MPPRSSCESMPSDDEWAPRERVDIGATDTDDADGGTVVVAAAAGAPAGRAETVSPSVTSMAFSVLIADRRVSVGETLSPEASERNASAALSGCGVAAVGGGSMRCAAWPAGVNRAREQETQSTHWARERRLEEAKRESQRTGHQRGGLTPSVSFSPPPGLLVAGQLQTRSEVGCGGWTQLV